MTKTVEALYLRDLVSIIVQRARRDVAERSRDDFTEGRLSALAEVISVMQSQARVFDLALDEFGLDQIDPDRELLLPFRPK